MVVQGSLAILSVFSELGQQLNQKNKRKDVELFPTDMFRKDSFPIAQPNRTYHSSGTTSVLLYLLSLLCPSDISRSTSKTSQLIWGGGVQSTNERNLT